MMNVLIVHESMFGNTRQIASAIADGMRDAAAQSGDVQVVHVDVVADGGGRVVDVDDPDVAALARAAAHPVGDG